MSRPRKYPCDGDCDNCQRPECVDRDGYWTMVRPEERLVLLGPDSPERRRVSARVCGRYRYAHDEAYRQHHLEYQRKYYDRYYRGRRKVMKWLSLAPCDGDCDNCRYDDCIDDNGVWDGVTPEERAILRNRKNPDWQKIYNRIYRRKRTAVDQEFRERKNKLNREACSRRNGEAKERLRLQKRMWYHAHRDELCAKKRQKYAESKKSRTRR